MIHKYSIIILAFLTISCKSLDTPQYVKYQEELSFDSKKEKTKNWHLYDIELDTIPGISLRRTYNNILVNKKPLSITVAVIDTEIDINHIELKSHIWINENEKKDNKIDDDKNGYVDDINGWNFLGNAQGENNKYVNFETTRILKKLNPYFEHKDTINLNEKDINLFKYYKSVLSKHKKRLKEYEKNKEKALIAFNTFHTSDVILSPLFEGKPYSIKLLDSLRKVNTLKIDDIHFHIMTELTKYNLNEEYFVNELKQANNLLDKLLSINYNDREIQNDDPTNMNDFSYGTNIINNNVEFLNHGTKMSGIIKGISQNNEIKIMPLAISAYGDEHDKDIALAIRYAVDNGAQIINMSFGKEYSLYKEWVFEAIKYAEKNDVLIISSAGNDSYNLNLMNENYPNDNVDNGEEISGNFIMVGSSSFSLTKDLKKLSSNYGSIDVDLFAPGDIINTTAPKNGYTTSSGTSPAGAITSGVAALIRSYYPDLTASEVKHILMDSGIEYTLEVATPTEEDPEKTTPFNQLSKSGKVLNAYNALLMAERISKGKRK
jgi:cell wall-associated protease